MVCRLGVMPASLMLIVWALGFLPRSTFRIVFWPLDNNANVDQSVSFQLSHDHVIADRERQHLLASQKGRFPKGLNETLIS